MPSQPAPAPLSIIPLGAWSAVVLADGSIILQHKSQVLSLDDGRVLDLSAELDDAQLRQLEQVGPENLGVRTMHLSADGSLHIDPGGISPGGVLTNQAFQLLEPTIPSAQSRRRDLIHLITDPIPRS